jgi:2-polyprenyl-6-methoxyphenol hydroxylase-like FAD-dependent oxidoreductase
MKRFDVVIVGARCAGSPLAMMLARRGLSVCLVDRARFPSETPSTHIIQPCGVQILDRLGLLDNVLAAGGVRLDRITLVSDDARIETTVDESLSEYPSLCVRRVTLDALLVEAAGAAGADVRTGSRVTRLVMADGRVAGVETDTGPIHATLVVGADGRHSTIASLVGAMEYHVVPPGRLPTWAYFEGVSDQVGRALLGRIGEMAYLAGHTDGGLYMAAVTTSFSNQAQFHADRDGYFTKAIQKFPELADLLTGARRVGPIRVVTNWHNYFRQAAGPGWVLVGDAGHFKDPHPGQGIGDAFRQGERLAQDIEDGLGNNTLDASMQRWWHWRDHDAYEMYWFAAMMGASGAQSPLQRSVFRGIAADDEASRMLFRVLNREVRPSQLFTPQRVIRGAAGVLRAEPRQIGPTLKEIVISVAQNIRQTRQGSTPPPGMTAAAWQ